MVKFNLYLTESDLKLIYDSLLFYRYWKPIFATRVDRFIAKYELGDFE